MGAGGVGKTSLVNQYVHQRFHKNYLQTLGEDVYSKSLAVAARSMDVRIHDLAGQEKFKNLRQTYMRGAQLGLAVYDLTAPQSLDILREEWFPDLTTLLAGQPFYLSVVGNKCDLDRRVKPEMGNVVRNYLRKHYPYIQVHQVLETSALTSENVQVAFDELVKAYVQSLT